MEEAGGGKEGAAGGGELVSSRLRLPLLVARLIGGRVVDSKWPRWAEEYDMSEGPQGNVFTSTPVDDTVAGASAS